MNLLRLCWYYEQVHPLPVFLSFRRLLIVITNQQPFLHEFIYPVLVAYDLLLLRADVDGWYP